MILLIDGMYLIFSSFYAHLNMRTFKGVHTGAIFGFISRLENLITDYKPEYITVAFDTRGKTFRHKIFPEYKAGRDAPPEELLGQIEHIKTYLELRGINSLEQQGFEADDIIAQFARNNQSDHQVVIFSADKDLYQLVNDKVNVYHPRHNKILNQEGILENYGIAPDKIIDYLALMGDSSDNIPGVKGIGDKTAKKILKEYGSIDRILGNMDGLDKKYKDKISIQLDALKLSRELVDLSKAPLIDDKLLKLIKFSDPATPDLIKFFEKFSLNSFINRFSDRVTVKKKKLELTYHTVRTTDQLTDLKEKICRLKYFSFDLETTGLNFIEDNIVGISISIENHGYYIPFIYPQNEDVSLNFSDFINVFGDLFSDSKIVKYAHNIKFDMLFLKQNGLEIKGSLHDTMIMSYLINPKRKNHRLKSLTFEILGYKQVEYGDLVQGKNKTVDFRMLDLDRAAAYCIDDSYLVLKLREIFENKLKELALFDLYHDLEIPLTSILIEMEHDGIKIDLNSIIDHSRRVKDLLGKQTAEIWELAGYDFNINSSKQVGELLFEKMELPVIKKTKKTGSYSTDSKTLEELIEHPVVDKILVYRRLKKLLSTYLEPLGKLMDKKHRIHTQFNQTITATGRLSSSSPNLQNIPVLPYKGVDVRACFIPEPGKKLLSADYSQVELRVLAHFAADDTLNGAFLKNMDIHQHTADLVFGDSEDISSTEKRQRAKIINFSIIYGSGAYSLSGELKVTFNEAKEFIEKYFEKYSGVKVFIDQVIESAERDGFVKTLFNRIREIPEIISSNKTVKESGKRIAVNTVIQGSAADIIKKAMIDISAKIQNMNARLILQVHDELIFEYPPEEENELLKIVKIGMENAVKLSIPLVVKMSTGYNWGELK